MLIHITAQRCIVMDYFAKARKDEFFKVRIVGMESTKDCLGERIEAIHTGCSTKHLVLRIAIETRNIAIQSIINVNE